MKEDRMEYLIRSAVYGFAIGDALGVPFEFKERDTFICTDMVGHGTWNQPAGTWSDDTSMMLATLDSIRSNHGEVVPLDIMNRFQDWYRYGRYAIDGNVFDVGNTVSAALSRFDGSNPFCGIDDVMQNGNGALMRILPLAFADSSLDYQVEAVAKLTHGHKTSTDYCIKYVAAARMLMYEGYIDYDHVWRCPEPLYLEDDVVQEIESPFSLPIKSSAYVADTFNAVMYCLATTDNYRDCVLKAVNLGKDTDTIAALAGGLAGIMYGYPVYEGYRHVNRETGIPPAWIERLRGKDIIESCIS